MKKYDTESIKEKKADFVEFRTALRDVAGHTLAQESEVILYSVWKR
jgi:hypothetical protein